jgi:methionyl-tRNA formyltransferase
MTRVDLLLGSDIGLWVLDRIASEHVCRVFAVDSNIAKAAAYRGIEVFLDNANHVFFEPSDIGFSVHYPRILHPPLLGRYQKILNLHPGFLPWGRGYYPTFWAIWEQSPAGATLHEISAGIDEGPIVAQRRVDQFPYETGGSLFERVREAEKNLFIEFWPRILAGEELSSKQQVGTGTYHSKKDFYDIKQECEWWKLDGESLVRLIRALSFPGYTGLEIAFGGVQFEAHLTSITREQSSARDQT